MLLTNSKKPQNIEYKKKRDESSIGAATCVTNILTIRNQKNISLHLKYIKYRGGLRRGGRRNIKKGGKEEEVLEEREEEREER